jgi:predicted TIM-barrel enzyme
MNAITGYATGKSLVIAQAVGAQFVRIKVHTGEMVKSERIVRFMQAEEVENR